MRRLSRHAYGAAVILVGSWLVLLALHAAFTYWEGTFPEHSVPWGVEWGKGVFENLQSEAWQVALAAWTFKHFFWRGAPESKDPDE